jgi:ankyrin repeat protein
VALEHGGNPNLQLSKAIIGRHHGFGDNSLSKGATALMRAAKSMDMDAIQLLVEAGADPTLGMANGSNALVLIAGTRPGPGAGGADKVASALRLLAKHGTNISAVNARGDTVLHTAAKAGNNAVVRVLAELGADLNAKDANGKTALDLVTSAGPNRHEDTAAILRELAAEGSKK